jgi:hypothetical protein
MQPIKEKNWFAVGLDVIVVIVGIFLGMQVTEWNEDRKGRLEAETIKNRLLADVERSARNISYGIEHLEAEILLQEQAAAIVLDIGFNVNNQAKLLELRKEFDSMSPIRVDTSTIDEIYSSGKVVLLEDLDLRNEVNSYRLLVNATQSFNQSYRDIGELIIELQKLAPTDFRDGKEEFVVPIEVLNNRRVEIYNAMKIIRDLNKIQLRFHKSLDSALSKLKQTLHTSLETSS